VGRGRNLRADFRWSGGDVALAQKFAQELVALKPDVIVGHTDSSVIALMRETQSTPIVFITVSDPIGLGFVESLSQPGGNRTGFINFEASFGGKWLEILKEIAPHLTRVGGKPGGGLVIVPDNFITGRTPLLVWLAARHRVPVVHPYPYFPKDGGLMSYGVDPTDNFRKLPDYVDRVLRGARPQDFRFSCRPRSSSLSTSRPRRRSASTFRHRSSPAPTR
jgi:putative tryptophan/tyrosine transport system substrate-binding protein